MERQKFLYFKLNFTDIHNLANFNLVNLFGEGLQGKQREYLNFISLEQHPKGCETSTIPIQKSDTGLT